MPQVLNGPKELNNLLETVYSSCMKDKKNATICSKVAWAAAKNAGWYKNKQDKWTKKSDAEIKRDELIKKGGIKTKIKDIEVKHVD